MTDGGNTKSESRVLEGIVKSIRIVGKFAAGSVTELLAFPWLPWEKRAGEDYLNKVREKVEFYKPKVEEKTGVLLGDIKVEDMDSSYNTITKRIMVEHIVEEMDEKSRPLTPYEVDEIVKTCSIFTLMAYLPTKVFLFSEAKFDEINNTIYKKCGPLSRAVSTLFGEHDRTIDELMVHEISHGLWYRLRWRAGLPIDSPASHEKEYYAWSEGFAMYCANDYFSEFYPPNSIISKVIRRGGVYRKGYHKIKEMVNKYGEGILMKIPLLVNENADILHYKEKSGPILLEK